MANTYVAIATVTVGSGGASSMEFTSIPATYTDLVILASTRGASGNNNSWIVVGFNSNTSNYSNRILINSSGTVVSSAPGDNPPLGGALTPSDRTASVFSNNFIYIPNYAGSNNKSFSVDGVDENNGSAIIQGLLAPLWSNTSAITSIQITTQGAGNFAQYSSATLYGIKNTV
jgi:hypothetical protein